MIYKSNDFNINFIQINGQNIKYYLSNLLSKFKFTHAFFTKDSSEFQKEKLANHFNNNKINYSNNQIHSNFIVLGSNLLVGEKYSADGIVSNNSNQNIWVYTADCMPILFADKSTRLVSAIHCGRKGLEQKIILNVLKQMQNLGSLKKDILVAIGPCISQANYLVDENCLMNFIKNIYPKTHSNLIPNSKYIFKHSKNKYSLDIKGFAFKQLIINEILPENIDILNSCTYEFKNEFHSWRRDKIINRNWNFISSK